MNKKVLVIATIAIITYTLLMVFLVKPSLAPIPEPQKEIGFVVTGKNDCLRFLNETVETCYVPFRVNANENWQLTINCTQMPGGANGWTDVYIYNGYWDKGTDFKCVSEDLYSILNEIDSADCQIRSNKPFSASYNGSTAQSYTVFFIFPPGGQSTFNIQLYQK